MSSQLLSWHSPSGASLQPCGERAIQCGFLVSWPMAGVRHRRRCLSGGWNPNASAVLAFYNERRTSVLAAQPNSAREAIARLESKFEVIVITQNIDDLHERAGSSNVIHVHGKILKARSSADSSLVYELNKPTIELGELCEKGSQLRPDVVWFRENVQHMEACLEHFAMASRVITVGTSLTVYPAAGLVKKAPFSAEKYLISPEAQKVPYGFRFLRGRRPRSYLM